MTEGTLPSVPWPVDIAYAAGVYEGEGTAYVSQKKGKPAKHATMCVAMTDLWVIERFRDIVGVGKVYGPYKRIPTKFEAGRNKQLWKVSYQWRASRIEDVQHVSDLIRALLSPRRKQQLDETIEADTRTAESIAKYGRRAA